ncbi:MAG TPA: hypothetical protein VKZ18_13655 [Polyangia bacterium]|nr:hypothetical protein [Polyangia bacterium]
MFAYSAGTSARVVALLVLGFGCGRSLQGGMPPSGSGGHGGSVGTTGAGGSIGSSGAGGSVGTTGAGGSVGTTGAGGSVGTTGAGGSIGTTGAGGSIGSGGGTSGVIGPSPGGPGLQGVSCATFADCECGLLCTNGACQPDQAHGAGQPGATCNRACDCFSGSVCLSASAGPACGSQPAVDGGLAAPTCGDYVNCQGNVAIYSIQQGVTVADFPRYGVCQPQGTTSCPPGSAVNPVNGYCQWSTSSSCALGATCSLDASTGYTCKGALGGKGQPCDVPDDCQCGLVCQSHLCTSNGGGAAGAACDGPCDCQAGLACASPVEGALGSCVAEPVPDAGAAAPKCGDHVDCFGAPVSSGGAACTPQMALTCPSGSTLDSTQSCTWSVASSCSSGLVCGGVPGGTYACGSIDI